MIRVVAAAVLDEQGRVLVARRGPDQVPPDVWELPGGKVEEGEEDVAALKRELTEELNLLVRVGGCIGESRHAYDHADVHLVAYLCQLSDARLLKAKEHAEVAWVTVEEARGLRWAPADVPLLDELYKWMDCVPE